MPLEALLPLLLLSSLLHRSCAFPTSRYDVVRRDDSTAANITISQNLNQTELDSVSTISSTGLPLSIVNSLSQGDGVNLYMTGNDASGLLVLLQPDGQWYYPPADISSTVPTVISPDQITIPVSNSGESTNITIPPNVSAGRIWLAQGSLQFSVVLGASGPALVEPSVTGPSQNATTWGFVEFTYTQDGVIYADISYVDFVSMNLGLTLTGADTGTQTTPGLETNAIQTLCEALENQATTDGYPWNELCVTDAQGQPVRVLAPSDYIQLNTDAFSDYWSSYVDQVWTTYASQPLVINSQSEQLGNISCTVSSDVLTCTDGSDAGAAFAQPSAIDIFSCASGPFALDSSATDVQMAVAPRLCAALNRSTLLLDGGNVQPDGVASDCYYSAQTTNWYSKLVHELELDGRGYAFAYDDVTPDSEASDPQNQSGEIVSANPEVLIITISL